jgi:hypothetical protein
MNFVLAYHIGFEMASETAKISFLGLRSVVGNAGDFDSLKGEWVGRYCALIMCQSRNILLKYAPVANDKMRDKKNPTCRIRTSDLRIS